MHAVPSILVVSHACSRAVNRAPYARLAELGWRVLIVTADALNVAGREIPSDARQGDDPPMRFVRLIGSGPRLQRFAGLSEILTGFAPDWVIADTDPHSLQAVTLARIKAKHGFRLGFISCENLEFGWSALAKRRGLRGIALAGFCALTRALVRPRTDMLFAINSDGVRLFRAAQFGRVVRTPLGFPEAHFHINEAARTKVRQQLGLRGPIIAYFGRMTHEKGVHLLLDALDQLVDHEWNLLLDDFQPVTGYQASIRQRVDSASWAQRVRFIEAKHGDVADYMNAADLVVVPSIATRNWKEQYGRVVPEALACGCWLIATRVGALPELLGTHGALVPELDADELAIAIRRCLGTAQERRNVNASRYALEQLSASAQARIWDQALRADARSGGRAA